MTDFSKTLRVELVSYVGIVDSAAGPVEIEYDQCCVRVHSELIKNERNMMEVGYIGNQKGAKFMPVNAFYNFHGPQRDWIASEAVRLHGDGQEGYMDPV